MFRLFPSLVGLGCVLAWPLSVSAQDDVRSILQKAIQAEQKTEQTAKYKAARFKTRGNIYQVEGATFTQEETIRDFEKLKFVEEININGQKIRYTIGFDGEKAWMKAAEFPVDESEINLTAHVMNELYLARVARLTPLLKFASTPPPPENVDHQKMAPLIHRLGDQSFAVREKASRELVNLGEQAVPCLLKAQKSSDLEVARRAERCLAIICAKETVFDLSPLPEILVEEKPAAGVRVRSRGHKDISLYFDKKTNLLVKLRRRTDDPATGEEVDEERIITEYQDVQGIQTTKKAVIFRNGNKYLDMELLEAKYLEKIDDREFIKP